MTILFPSIMPTGLQRMDDLLGGGLRPGELTVLAGFPGVGKSAMLDTLLLHISRSFSTALFTLKSSRLQRVAYLLAQLSEVDGRKVGTGDLNDEELNLVERAFAELRRRRLKLDDTVPQSLDSVRKRCLLWRSQGGLDLVALDHVSLLVGPGATDYEFQSGISRGLKRLARDTGAHVLAVLTLDRLPGPEKPDLACLRRLGTWEEDADNIEFLY
jgi:replicative DNA helicase